MYAGWHGEAARPDLQAHQNSHWSRGNSSESICAWGWLQNNYFAISPVAVPVFPSSQSRWGMSGELRPLERGVCTPELVSNNEFMPQYPFQNFQALVQGGFLGRSLCQLNLHKFCVWSHSPERTRTISVAEGMFRRNSRRQILEPWRVCYTGWYSAEVPRKNRGNLPAHKLHVSWSLSSSKAFGNQGEVWKLLMKGNISMEKLLSASKLELEKSKLWRVLCNSSQNPERKHCQRFVFSFFPLGGPFLLEWPTFSGLNAPKLIALRPLPSPHPLFFLFSLVPSRRNLGP